MRNFLFSLLAAPALVCAACQSPNYEPPDPKDGIPEEVWSERISMSNDAALIVKVARVNQATKNGLQCVQVTFETRSPQNDKSFRTLIDWFDASGFRLSSANDGWKSHIIRPGQPYLVDSMATNPDAVFWRMSVDTWKR